MRMKNYVKNALDKAKDNRQSAVRLLINKSKIDHKFKDALLFLGAKQLVRDFYSQQRVSAMSMAAGRVMANLTNPDVQDRVASRLARVAFWDAYTLFGMTPIADANKNMLLESAKNREQQANSELRLAKFERAVADILKGNKTVRECLSLAQLEKIAAKYRSKDNG